MEITPSIHREATESSIKWVTGNRAGVAARAKMIEGPVARTMASVSREKEGRPQLLDGTKRSAWTCSGVTPGLVGVEGVAVFTVMYVALTGDCTATYWIPEPARPVPPTTPAP